MPKNFSHYNFEELLKSADDQPQYFTTVRKVVAFKNKWRTRKIKKIKSQL